VSDSFETCDYDFDQKDRGSATVLYGAVGLEKPAGPGCSVATARKQNHNNNNTLVGMDQLHSGLCVGLRESIGLVSSPRAPMQRPHEIIRKSDFELHILLLGRPSCMKVPVYCLPRPSLRSCQLVTY